MGRQPFEIIGNRFFKQLGLDAAVAKFPAPGLRPFPLHVRHRRGRRQHLVGQRRPPRASNVTRSSGVAASNSLASPTPQRCAV